MRGQLHFRELRWHGRYPDQQSGKAYAGVGVVEMHPGEHPVERLLSVVVTGSYLHLTGEEQPVDAVHRYSDMAHLVTSLDFSAPTAALGLGGGSLILRETRIPATQEGQVVCAALLVVRNTDIDFDSQTIYNLSQVNLHRYELTEARRAGYDPTGMALEQLSKRPVWGWGAEKWGPVSTLHLDAIDQAQAYQDRENAGESHPADTPSEMRWLFSHYRDEQFRRFVKAMNAEGHGVRWDEALTESQCRARDEAATRIVNELLTAA